MSVASRRALLLILFVLGTVAEVGSASAQGLARRRTGSLLVQLVVVASPERDSGTVVLAITPHGLARSTRADSLGRAFFPSLPHGWYLVCAPGASDTLGVGVSLRETTRVVLSTRQRGHVRSVFR